MRNRIYEYALGGNVLYALGARGKRSCLIKTPCRVLLQLQKLSCVCRQLYHESRLLPYTLNKIWFGTPGSFAAWSRQVSWEVKFAVRCVHFEYVYDTFPFLVFRELEEMLTFPNLAKVVVWSGAPGKRYLEAFVREQGGKWQITEEDSSRMG